MPPQIKVPYLLGKIRHFPIINIKEIFNLDNFFYNTLSLTLGMYSRSLMTGGAGEKIYFDLKQ